MTDRSVGPLRPKPGNFLTTGERASSTGRGASESLVSSHSVGLATWVFIFCCVPFFVVHVWPTVEEKHVWLTAMEAEANDKLACLTASMSALDPQKPTSEQLNDVLSSAFQGQLTLMRMSRVFPDRRAVRRVQVSQAMAHPPTAALARRLHHCWKVLGVTEFTLKAILRKVVFTVGRQTWTVRERVYVDRARRSPQEQASQTHEVLAAEGSGQSQVLSLEM